jgi:hypothetical protein
VKVRAVPMSLSPLLLNVALHGMEHALGIYYTPKGVRRGPYALVRYADDLVRHEAGVVHGA